jgi:hypothetical protein
MVMVLLQKVLPDFKSFNVDVIALGDLQINDNIGLTYLTGVNFSSSEYDQRGGSYKNFTFDNNSFTYDNALIVDKTTF